MPELHSSATSKQIYLLAAVDCCDLDSPPRLVLYSHEKHIWIDVEGCKPISIAGFIGVQTNREIIEGLHHA